MSTMLTPEDIDMFETEDQERAESLSSSYENKAVEEGDYTMVIKAAPTVRKTAAGNANLQLFLTLQGVQGAKGVNYEMNAAGPVGKKQFFELFKNLGFSPEELKAGSGWAVAEGADFEVKNEAGTLLIAPATVVVGGREISADELIGKTFEAHLKYNEDYDKNEVAYVIKSK